MKETISMRNYMKNIKLKNLHFDIILQVNECIYKYTIQVGIKILFKK